MHKIARRILMFGLVGPVLLAPLVVLGGQKRDYPWWRYLVAIVGGGYLIPVFGTLFGWKLLAVLRTASYPFRFALRAFVGMFILSGLIMVVTTREPVNTAKWLFCSPGGLIMLLAFGVLYAGLPTIVVRWLNQRK